MINYYFLNYLIFIIQTNGDWGLGIGDWNKAIEDLEDLYYNILCLIYYFKIPIIDQKWIETLRTHDKEKDFREKIVEKLREKKKEKEKHEEEINKNKEKEINLAELKENIIPDIIAMLTELFWQVKNYLVKLNKINNK